MQAMTGIVEQVPAREWAHWRDKYEAIVLDVREPIEWTQGVLPDAEKMALSTIATDWQRLDPQQPILIVCRSGNRSNSVAQALVRAGFSRVANLAGGMVALGLA